MKKTITAILLLAMLLTTAAGCTPKTTATPAPTAAPTATIALEPTPATWSITVEGATKTAFTLADMTALESKCVELSATLKKSDGSSTTNLYYGLPVSELLIYIGAEAFTSVTFYAADGFSATLSPDVLSYSSTILAIKMDGEPIDTEKCPMTVVGLKPGNMWVKGIAKITIDK